MIGDAFTWVRAPGPPATALASAWLAACVAAGPPPAPPADLDPDGTFGGIVDHCPDLPEDRDGFEDDDGRPDRDNDGDGILDAHSWDGRGWINCDGRLGLSGEVVKDCRDLPETVDGREDDDGCPEVFSIGCAHFHIDLAYDPATLALDEDAPALLDELAAFIARRPDIDEIYIDGHAAPRPGSGDAKVLSRRAAERVQAELVRRGGPMLEIRSFGDVIPRSTNDTPEGRRANARVGVSWCEPDEERVGLGG